MPRHTIEAEVQGRFMDDVPRQPSVERQGFVAGLFDALREQLDRHLTLVRQLATLQGKVQVSERNLALTRDHLQALLEDTADEMVPEGWEDVLSRVRFVGVRLGSACLALLREHDALSTEELEIKLNEGQFRFNTGTPLREINAALLRQRHVVRIDDRWHYRPRTRVRAH